MKAQVFFIYKLSLGISRKLNNNPKTYGVFAVVYLYFFVLISCKISSEPYGGTEYSGQSRHQKLRCSVGDRAWYW